MGYRSQGGYSSVLFFGLLAFAATFLVLLWQAGVIRKTKSPAVFPAQKITIGNIGEYSLLNLVAADQGIFARNGLDAVIREYDAGPSAMGALISHEVDVSIAADFVGVTNIFKNDHIRILTQAGTHQVFHAIARHDKGVRQPADLRGKRIGVTRKSAGEFYLGRFLNFNNLSLRDVEVVDLPPLSIVEAFESGTVDAAVIFDPHAFNIERKFGGAVSSWSAQGEQKTFALIYSTDEFIGAHPDTVKRYIRSLVEAQEYLEENPLKAQSILAKVRGYSDEYVERTWPHFSHSVGIDQELLLAMEDQAHWLIQNRLTEALRIPNYLKFIYLDALESVSPEMVTIIR